MQKPEYAQENETHKILWDFETQTDQSIPTRRPDLYNNFKKFVTLLIFAIPVDY